MPYRRFYRRVLWNTAKHAFIGAAAASAGRHAYNKVGRPVIGKVGRALGRLGRWWRGSKKGVRRKMPKRFLKSIGMSANKFVVHVSRGSATVDFPTVDGTFNTVATWSLNDPRLPVGSALAGGAAAWNTLCATGYDHMLGLYKRHCVLGTKLIVTIRQRYARNLQYAESGTSSYTSGTMPLYKVGIHPTEGTLADDGITSWDKACMHADPMRTRAFQYGQSFKPITLVLKWSLRKHVAAKDINYVDNHVYGASGDAAPSTLVYAKLWGQIADKISTAAHSGTFEISWTMKQFTRWSDFLGPESDMGQNART